MSDLVLLWTDNGAIREQVKRAGMEARPFDPRDGRLSSTAWPQDCDRALIVGPGLAIPWHLLDAGFNFVKRWDMAAPLFERELAANVGTDAEREATRAIVRDLRVPVVACELLFLRHCEASRALLAAWADEWVSNPRLAFLRALYRVKPAFLALPRTWLCGAPAMPQSARVVSDVAKSSGPYSPRNGLVQVEVAPGRYVCCRPDEVERYKAQFQLMRSKRRV